MQVLVGIELVVAFAQLVSYIGRAVCPSEVFESGPR